MIADRLPTVLLGYVESDDGFSSGFEGMSEVCLDDLPGYRFITIFLDVGSKLIIKDIRKAFKENQWQDKVLELRRVG